MTTMTRGLRVSRRAVVAATTRNDAAHLAPSTSVGSVGRPAMSPDYGLRVALEREYAWVEAAATAALRGGRA